MDLHAWITQQVDETERIAREAEGFPLNVVLDAIDVAAPGGHARERHITRTRPAAVLRRCEADRRILARHRLDPNVTYEPACEGCGTYGDMDLPEIDNLNDCPELLDLAHAHGITDDILASLDQPQIPEPPPRNARRLGLGDIHATPPITTSQVPAALRGPRWKP